MTYAPWDTLAKAWVKFTTVTTTAITDSYGVSSLTDNGVGDTTINFTTSFANANYAWVATTDSTPAANMIAIQVSGTAPTTSALRISFRSGSAGGAGDGLGSVVCFGDH